MEPFSRFTTSLGRKLSVMTGLLGALWVACGMWTLTRLGQAGTAPEKAEERDAVVLSCVPRMSEVLQDSARGFTQRVATTVPEEAAALDRELLGVRGRMWFETARLRQAAPQFGGALGQVEKAFQELAVTGERAREAARARQVDRARTMMRSEFGPRLDQLRIYFGALGLEVRKQHMAGVRREQAAQVAAARGAVWWGLVIMGLALAGGYLWNRQFVARPLEALATCARRLAQRDVDLSIPGGGREDELGALAGGLGQLRRSLARELELESGGREREEQIARLRESVAAQTRELEVTRKELVAANGEVALLRGQIESAAVAAEAGLTTLRATLREREAEVAGLRDVHGREVARASGELDAVRTALGAKVAELEQVRGALVQAEAEAKMDAARAETELTMLRATLREREAEVAGLGAVHGREVARAGGELDAVRAALSAKEAELERVRAALEQAEAVRMAPEEDALLRSPEEMAEPPLDLPAPLPSNEATIGTEGTEAEPAGVDGSELPPGDAPAESEGEPWVGPGGDELSGTSGESVTEPPVDGTGEPAVPKPKATRRKRVPRENPQLDLLAAGPVVTLDDEVRQLIEAGKLPGIDMDDAMSRLGFAREEIEKRLIEAVPGQRRHLRELRGAWEAEDREQARELAHALAGEAGELAEHEFRRLAKTVELAIKFQQGDVGGMIAELERETARVFAGLEWLARRSSGSR